VLLACIEVRSEAHKFDSFMFLPLNFVQIDDGENKRKDGKFKAVKKKVKTKLSALAKGKIALVMACFQDLGKYMMVNY
jgi:hypothetical protein